MRRLQTIPIGLKSLTSLVLCLVGKAGVHRASSATTISISHSTNHQTRIDLRLPSPHGKPHLHRLLRPTTSVLIRLTGRTISRTSLKGLRLKVGRLRYTFACHKWTAYEPHLSPCPKGEAHYEKNLPPRGLLVCGCLGLTNEVSSFRSPWLVGDAYA